MASTKVKAIVIGGTNVKEKDKLLTLFSLEDGKISVSMKGVRGEKAKLKSAKEVFTFGEFVIEEGKYSKIVTSVDVIDNFYALSADIEKYYEACGVIDVLNKIATEPNPQLFIETIKALKTLCYEDVKKYYVIDKFLLSIFGAMGYGFLGDKCSSCGAKLEKKYFNYSIGEIVCPACRTMQSEEISGACYSALKLLNNTDYDNLHTIKLGGLGEVQAYNLLAKNFEYRTGFSIIQLV
ncbi:MAG: DNA repair protein RecO [Clostridia bacterium]|nr:DNA repair protein RecO [Clostridia bacterium]